MCRVYLTITSTAPAATGVSILNGYSPALRSSRLSHEHQGVRAGTLALGFMHLAAMAA
jgi:hypothetical protein